MKRDEKTSQTSLRNLLQTPHLFVGREGTGKERILRKNRVGCSDLSVLG